MPAPTSPAKAASVKPVKSATLESGNVSSITNKDFAQLALNSSAIVAGVVKEVKEKEGTFAPVTQFKGEFAIQRGSVINTSKTLYLPEAAKSALRSELAKISGGWETAEFRMTVSRTEKGYGVLFQIAPRKEQDKAISLLKSA